MGQEGSGSGSYREAGLVHDDATVGEVAGVMLEKGFTQIPVKSAKMEGGGGSSPTLASSVGCFPTRSEGGFSHRV